MVAAKFLDDFYYSNEFWAKIGGVPNAELNTLELEFLFLTNFDLQVKRGLYNKYRSALLDWAADNTNNQLGIGDGLRLNSSVGHFEPKVMLPANGQGKIVEEDNVDMETGDEGQYSQEGQASVEPMDTPPPVEGAETGDDDMAMD
jgi:hypothetical protein